MLKRKNKDSLVAFKMYGFGNGELISDELYCYINNLKDEASRLKEENSSLKSKYFNVKAELDEIKPLVERKEYTPAISKDCEECKFALLSRLSGAVIGCRKNCLCDDFKRKGE